MASKFKSNPQRIDGINIIALNSIKFAKANLALGDLGVFRISLLINASSFFSKKIRDWDRVAFGS